MNRPYIGCVFDKVLVKGGEAQQMNNYQRVKNGVFK